MEEVMKQQNEPHYVSCAQRWKQKCEIKQRITVTPHIKREYMAPRVTHFMTFMKENVRRKFLTRWLKIVATSDSHASAILYTL
jgi:hypothetical protein